MLTAAATTLGCLLENAESITKSAKKIMLTVMYINRLTICQI